MSGAVVAAAAVGLRGSRIHVLESIAIFAAGIVGLLLRGKAG